jgi:hypothetical protein
MGKLKEWSISQGERERREEGKKKKKKETCDEERKYEVKELNGVKWNE